MWRRMAHGDRRYSGKIDHKQERNRRFPHRIEPQCVPSCSEARPLMKFVR